MLAVATESIVKLVALTAVGVFVVWGVHDGLSEREIADDLNTRGIVTDLGGRLTAHNAEDGGAVFEMQLPVLASASGRTPKAAE